VRCCAILANGAQFARYVYGITDAAEIGKRTVDQAKADLKISIVKVPTPQGKSAWAWRLPESATPAAQSSADDGDDGDDEDGDEGDAVTDPVRLCNLATLRGSRVGAGADGL
jgi:hypothetical protein